LKIQLNKIKKIIVTLVIAGLILDKKNFLWEFKEEWDECRRNGRDRRAESKSEKAIIRTR
jgi:hypothetical protein